MKVRADSVEAAAKAARWLEDNVGERMPNSGNIVHGLGWEIIPRQEHPAKNDRPRTKGLPWYSVIYSVQYYEIRLDDQLIDEETLLMFTLKFS